MVRMRRTVTLAVVGVLLLAVDVAAAAPPRWGNVAIGGGGYVTGIVVHPDVRDLVYARTDIGGAYRWNAAGGRWVPITDRFPMDQGSRLGIESLAVDPGDADTVYLAAGRGTGSLYRSTNRGSSWTKLPLDLAIDGNADRRWSGERLAVDPFDSRRVLFGSRADGLHRSTNAGSSWARVTTFTPAPTAFGIVAVAFDPARRNVVYASAYGDGMYRSADGGTTWARLGGPTKVLRFAIAPNGSVITAGESAPQVGRYTAGTWTDLTPAVTARGYSSVVVNPFNASELVAVTGNTSSTDTHVWRSTNGGSTWVRKTAVQVRSVGWWPDSYFTAHTSALAFDPFTNGRVWLADWFGVWRTERIAAQPATWTSRVAGHEETAVFSMIAPPAGPELLTGVADVSAFRHQTDVDAYPAMVLPDIKEIYGLAFSWTRPQRVVAVGGDRVGSFTARRSTDGGRTWQVAAGYPSSTMPKRVAVSSTNPQTWVVTRAGRAAVRTGDDGATFTTVSGLPAGMDDPWDIANALAADPVDGNRFYYFDNPSGRFYRSTDGGRTFARTATLPASLWEGAGVETGSRGGELYVWADRGGLHRSTNGGTSFTEVANVARARGFAMGEPPASRANPTLYVYGQAGGGGGEGVYRSLDGGVGWTRVDDPATPVPPVSQLLEASWRETGTLYIGSGGRGAFRGIGLTK